MRALPLRWLRVPRLSLRCRLRLRLRLLRGCLMRRLLPFLGRLPPLLMRLFPIAH
jgi:hypothetical protein